MITSDRFDLVFDCQKVFKQLMDALAMPGKIRSIAREGQNLEHPQLRWITAEQIPQFSFCPADAQILHRLQSIF